MLVMKNDQKTPLFSVQERVEMLGRAVANIPGVCVETAEGLLADYARTYHVQVLVRGLRGNSDIEPEFCAAYFNKQLYPQVETLFLPACSELKYVSSSSVKQAVQAGADVSRWVPVPVVEALRKKIK